MKTNGIYKITNNETGEFYVGSSKNIERRWREHKRPSAWKKYPNNRMYQDMKMFGTDAFTLEVLEECENLVEREQHWIDALKPTYNTVKACNRGLHGISGVYKITCTVTGDFYIGSSINVKRRWVYHKCPSSLKKYPNNRMYQDMYKYGIEAFTFEILIESPQELLKRKEQEAIETLRPTYNSCDAYATEESEFSKNKERYKSYRETHKEELKVYMKTYYEAHKDEHKAYMKAYREAHKEENKHTNPQ